LLVVTDNGFNMIKAVANVTEDISETDIEEQEEELNEEGETQKRSRRMMWLAQD
jgi:hypothetical protein